MPALGGLRPLHASTLVGSLRQAVLQSEVKEEGRAQPGPQSEKKLTENILTKPELKKQTIPRRDVALLLVPRASLHAGHASVYFARNFEFHITARVAVVLLHGARKVFYI